MPDKPSLSFEAGFPTEASLLKNLNHPGIPIIYDIEEDDTSYYIIEEFIRGESLDTFVLHQETISQELIIEFCIQLCEILDYLHHYAPYSILYQDLKPEHIILCGNQLKLIDFGIASFFTGSGKHFQKFGTKGYAAPEAVAGLPVATAADIYSLGKVLAFLAEHAAPGCSTVFTEIIAHATADNPRERYQDASQMKTALLHVKNSIGRPSSHLICNIAVVGSQPGVGCTHISISLVSTLNKLHHPTLYLADDHSRTLEACTVANPALKEIQGIYRYGHFRGIPSYGEGIAFSYPKDFCILRDYGTALPYGSELADADFILFVLSGSDWDIESAIASGRQFLMLPQTVFICNFENQAAARRCAKKLGRPVYCFPIDCNPYHVTAERERLVRNMILKKGGPLHFWF